jgi:hypothetical protein
MGNPVGILDLAHSLIRQCGKSPSEIKIEFFFNEANLKSIRRQRGTGLVPTSHHLSPYMPRRHVFFVFFAR